MSRILVLILLSALAGGGLSLASPERLIPTSPIWTPTPTPTATREWRAPEGPDTNTEEATPTPAATPTPWDGNCTNCQ